MTPDEEAAIRADERLKTLRKVRKAAIKVDKDPNNDPYLWGYGGSRITAMLSGLVAAERARQEEGA